MVSVEKMPTNILRKLEIPVDLKVVAAQIRAVTPIRSPSRLPWMVGWISATRPNSATAAANSLMGYFQIQCAGIDSAPSKKGTTKRGVATGAHLRRLLTARIVV